MPKHKDQRVGVFVDVQNLYYSAKQFYSAKVNFAYILKEAIAGRQLIRAIAYVIKADIKEEHNFFDALEKIGYDVRSKDLQIFYTGAKKGDWDVGIAMDIMRMAAKLDVVVLVSGDGDFKDLLEHCKALGCRAEVIAFGKTSSSRLLNEADEMIDLGKVLDKVLIKDYKNTKKEPQKFENKVSPKKAPYQKKVPYQKKAPYQKKPYKNDNYNKTSYSNNNSFKKDNYHNDNDESEASLLQKINMDQPLFKPVEQTKLEMPNKTQLKGNKKVEAKSDKQVTPNNKSKGKKVTGKKIPSKKTQKKTPEKTTSNKTQGKVKDIPKKKDSLMKKVMKKVTRK